MITINLDSHKKAASITLNLKGEDKPIQLNIDNYSISQGSEPTLSITSASSDRLWVDALIKNFLKGKSFNLPKNSAQYLKLIDDVLK